ncbi:helix-turn-helix domain-containing protein [Hyphomicrobium sp.]|uniref:AraC-like ligand-binding domain-containing protein n=1 Tax=Hyphomicrobium sp. TaxID=82 RepID=UPI000FBE9124|nr:helix-turn-helix domain-containing protein [Hyphomicrobium sp.]RUP11068.1 MAG: helix-turn-helix domain-containing protein [Hyphomicrobium sp.]
MLRTLGDQVISSTDDFTEYIINTSDVHPRDRFQYWFQSTRRVLGPYENRPFQRANFEGDLRYLRVPGMSLSVFRCNGMRAWRTERQANLLGEFVHVVMPLTGSVKLRQDGREAQLNAGDICLIDVGRPSTLIQTPHARCLVVELSRREGEARLGQLNRWTARRIDGGQGGGALASAFARLLPDQISYLSGPAQAEVARQFLDLCALSVKEMDGTAYSHSSARLASLLRLKSVVDANLTNCNATCEELAAAAGISVRYANQLLDAEQTSLQKLLFNRRIEKCQAALADPAQAHRQISDIAYSWGFGDVSHFGRLFKAMTGMTPRDYKKFNLTALTKSE